MAVYSFASAHFETVVAHDGGEIRFSRVEERAPNPGCIFIDLSEIPVGSSIGEHRHGWDDEEIYVVIDGVGSMLVDGRTVTVQAGDVVVNHPGGTHALRNEGDVPLRIVVIDVGAEGRYPSEPTAPDGLAG